MNKIIKTIIVLISIFLMFSVLWIQLDFKTPSHLVSFSDSEKSWIRANPIITVAIDPSFAPYEFKQDDQYLGLTMDYLTYLESVYDLTFKVTHDSDWSDSIAALKNKNVDILSAVAQSPQRDEFMLFTEPYITIQNVVLVREGADTDFSETDFSSKYVAVIKDYFAQDLLELHYPGIKLYKAADIEDGLRALSFGRVDAFVSDSAQASHYIPKVGVNNLTMNENIQLGFDLSLNMGVRKDAPELRNILSKMIIGIPDSIHKEIQDKWTTPSYDPGISRILFISLAGIGFMLLLSGILVVLWNTSLNIQVTNKTQNMQSELRRRKTVENQLDALINAIPYPVSLKNHEGYYLYVNQAYSAILKTTADKLLNHKAQDFEHLITKENAQMLSELDQDILKKNKPIHLHAQKINIQGTGEKIYEVTKIPFVVQENEPHGILTYSVDITEQSQSEMILVELNEHLEEIVESRLSEYMLKNEELIESLNQLQESEHKLLKLNTELSLSVEVLEKTQNKLVDVEKFAALGRAASGVAHKMNTPLGVGISAASYGLHEICDIRDIYTQTIQAGEGAIFENPSQQLKHIYESLLLIQTSISRMVYVTDVLNSVTSNVWGDKSTSIIMKDLVQSCYDAYIGTPNQLININLKTVLFELECLSTLKYKSSEQAIKTLFTNLISNSIEHGFVAYKQPHKIHIRCYESQNSIHILYSDNGIGVNENELSNILEPLFTTKRGSEHLGLGLSIVYNIVTHYLNGNLEIFNIDGGGLSLHIIFPNKSI